MKFVQRELRKPRGRVVLLSFLFLSTISRAEKVNEEPHFVSANTCAKCHQTQHREWNGSMMHYAARSPVVHAFELSVRKQTGRFGAHDPENPTLCINCHSPVAAYNNEMAGLIEDEPSVNLMGPVAREGITCTVCHTINAPKPRKNLEKGLFGDGISNAAFNFWPTERLIGPTIQDPLPKPNVFHMDGFDTSKTASTYLKSSQFCGSCHDVRLPQTPDSLSGEGFQRIENLFTEWAEGPYNSTKNPHGKVVGCTDCHMSLYGSRDPKTGKTFGPGSFPEAQVAVGFDRVRKHALHAFTAVSTTLIDEPGTFPNQNTDQKDAFGFPMGQEQRRQQLLKQACKLEWGKTEDIFRNQNEIPLELVVTNTGAGHRVPSGFSQERQMWVELKVRDNRYNVIFSSGYLVDKAHAKFSETKPDGKLDDEDLEDVHIQFNRSNFEIKSERMGPDFNLRPFRDFGVPQFNNAFMRKVEGRKGYERVHLFFLPSSIDNDRSLPMLQPIAIRYSIPMIEKNYCGSLFLEARLLFRAFPPKILRLMAEREPELLSEANVDRNLIVEMQKIQKRIIVCDAQSAGTNPIDLKKQNYHFNKNGKHWIGFYQPKSWESAVNACQAEGCSLPSVAEYDSLGYQNYKPQPGDNKDELWKERWTRDEVKEAFLPSRATYLFTGGENRTGEGRVDNASVLSLPFFCICSPSKEAK